MLRAIWAGALRTVPARVPGPPAFWAPRPRSEPGPSDLPSGQLFVSSLEIVLLSLETTRKKRPHGQQGRLEPSRLEPELKDQRPQEPFQPQGPGSVKQAQRKQCEPFYSPHVRFLWDLKRSSPEESTEDTGNECTKQVA